MPLICPGRSLVLTEQVARAFAEANTPFRIAVEVSHAHAAIAMVRAGVGIALVDGFGMLGALAEGLSIARFTQGLTARRDCSPHGCGRHRDWCMTSRRPWPASADVLSRFV